MSTSETPVGRKKGLKRKFKQMIILAGALAIIGPAILYYEVKLAPQNEEAEKEEQKLISLKNVHIQTITLVDGGTRFKFECTDSGEKLCKVGDHSNWRMVEPVNMLADKANVNALLSSINNLKADDTVDLSKDSPEQRATQLKEYGLDEASRADAGMRRIEVTANENRQLVAYLGATNPIDNKIFAARSVNGKFEDAKIMIVPSFFKSNFEKGLTHWRDKNLLSWTTSQIESLKYERPGLHLTANRSGDSWDLKVGEKQGTKTLPGDHENINSLLNALTNLKAKDFVAENKTDRAAKSALAGAKKLLSVTLHNPSAQGNKEIQVQIYEKQKEGKTDKILATLSSSDPLYEVDKGTKSRIEKELKDFRVTRFISSLERFSVNKLEFQNVGKYEPITYLKKDSQWITTSADAPIPDSETVQKLFDKMSGKRIMEYQNTIPKDIQSITSGKAGLIIHLSTEGESKTPVDKKFAFMSVGEEVYAYDLSSPTREVMKIDNVLKKHLPWEKDFFAQKGTQGGSADTPGGAPDAHFDEADAETVN